MKSTPKASQRGLHGAAVAKIGRTAPRDLFGRIVPAPPRSGKETRLHIAIVEYIRWTAPELLVFHSPNEGLRAKAEAAKLKAMGLLAGIPDLAIIAPGGRVFFLEVKTPAGRLSPEQIAVHDHLVALGTPCAVARSIDDARRAFEVWGLPTLGGGQ